MGKITYMVFVAFMVSLHIRAGVTRAGGPWLLAFPLRFPDSPRIPLLFSPLFSRKPYKNNFRKTRGMRHLRKRQFIFWICAWI